jgi:1,5-anhydro-D-fructose reductase (1,5-anhydro-D-mannitol-forming)
MTQPAQRTLRYGIIGFGRFAENAIVPAIRNARNSAIVALQKRSLQAARKKADEHAVPMAFASVEELVRHPDVDAVFIVSANAAHHAETIAAADAGKHVIVEKPMAMNVREAEEMIAACKRNNVRLMVGHMVRLSPLISRIKEVIASGAIGRVTSARTEFMYDGRNSHRTWLIDRTVAGGGPVFDIGVHCIDTLRAILADEPASIASVLWPIPTRTATEETAFIDLRFTRGVVASVFCSYVTPFRRTLLEIFGTEGVISAPDFTLANQTARLAVTKGKGDRQGATSIEDIVVPNLYVEEVSLFTDWVLGGRPPDIDGENGLKNQHIIDRALEGNPR